MEASYFLLSIHAAFLSNHGSVLIPAVEGHKHYYDYISVKSILGEAECNAEAVNIISRNSTALVDFQLPTKQHPSIPDSRS